MTSLTKRRTRVLVFVAVLAMPAALAGEVICPPTTPPAGTTVNGGLDVVGTCVVDSVTVNGGITIESGGHLQLTSSTVNGGIVTLPCGEIDVNALTANGTPTGTMSTINGGIDIAAGAVCTTPLAMSNADIWTAQINGGVSITGTYSAGDIPFICHNQIKGNVDVHNATVPLGFVIGDPDEGFGSSCIGNTISGALIMGNSSLFKVESNAIGGSVLLSASTLELNGNAIGGSLKCSDGTVIVPGEPPDPSGNTVHGSTHCGP